MTFWL